MKHQNCILIGLIFLCTISISAQYVTDPLPYAPIANPLPDTMDQKLRDSVNLKFSPIRLNQAGYRPQDKKYFYYVGTASNFIIIDKDGKNVGSGILKATGQSAKGQLKIKASNNSQLVNNGDTRYTMQSPPFSGNISEGLIPDNLPPGEYRIVVGSETSHPFVVDEKVYSWVRDALLKFYGANRCGDSKSWFHTACHLKDPVIGGWHDCGDHLKEGATMSYTASVLGLAAAAFFDRDADVYSANQGITQVTDGIPDILYEAKHGADFILRSYDQAGGQVSKMVTSVGDFGKDHMWWGRPENQDKMPASRGGPPRPGRNEVTTDYLGNYAANLAFVSKRMRIYDEAYADHCLKAAKDIYTFTKPRVDITNTGAYNGSTIASDDAAFACLALLWATGERTYLEDLCYDKKLGAKVSAGMWQLFEGGWFTYNDPIFTHTYANTDWASTQAHVLWGFFRLILNDSTMCTKINITETERLKLIEKTVHNLVCNLGSVGAGTQIIQLPNNNLWVQPQIKYDLPWFTMHTQQEWVWNRYQAGNITEMFYYYDIASKIQGLELPNSPASTNWHADEVKTVLVRMMDYMFGVNPWDISMVYGVGDKNFNHPHHRAANPEGKNVPGAFYKYVPPVGALQGGYLPTTALYDENWSDYQHSETGIDGTTNLLMPVVGLAKEDTVGPPKGTVRILYVGCDKAIIEIRQSRYGDASVRYGKGTATEKTVNSDSSGVLHQIILSGLAEGTAYNFDVVVKDVFGRESVLKNINEERQEVNFTFTTLQNCPTDADIENVKVCKVTHDSAEIFWYTPNGEFDSKVVYGEQIPPTKVQDGDISGHPTRFHYVKIGGLKEKTKYYFYVESGTSRDDNNGQYYTFTTPVEFVKFDVRTLRYEWGSQPGVGINIVNQDSKAYDSLEIRLYFRAKEGFETDLGARLDICVLYHEDGFQDQIEGALRTQIWNNLVKQKPTKMEDTYDPSDQTYAYYLALPLWGVEMRSQSRIRLDIIFDTWEKTRLQDLLGQAPEHKISDKDWSFGPHSKNNGDPIDFPGVPNLPKDDVDNSYWEQPINYYVTIYRKEEYVWGYSPSKAELATKKTHFELTTQITSPINNPNADYYLYEGTGKTLLVKGYANLTPVDGRINDIWVNGVRQQNPSTMVTWSETSQNYNFSIPVPVKNGRNLVDVTIFAGPSEDCQECFGCAVSNHSFFLEAPFIQQYPSQMVIKDQNMGTIGDTVKIDTTQFHIIVTDKNGNVNKKGKDSLVVSVYNPSNGDSNVVTLVETADSSNVFQTVTPIKVVNLLPEQTGKTQIAMGGAEQLIITYVDPTDETDSSKVTLYSRAEFPVPLAGWVYDSDGNGSVDKLVVLYNQKLKDDPDSIQITFPNAASVKMFKKPTDTFSMDDKKETVVFGAAFENITGFTNGLTGNGISYIVSSNRVKALPFGIRDSAGPVLLNQAVLSEKEGSGDDTVMVTFSEAVSFDHLSGDVLLLRKNGTDYPVKVNAICGVVQGTYTTTLNIQCTQKIEEGDSLLIDPKGVLDDLAGNRAHPKNKPVVVTVKAAPPQLVSACYRDMNADGVIDRIDITVNKPVVVQECTFITKWNDKRESRIEAGSASVSNENSRIINIAVKGNEITGLDIVTSGVMTVTIDHKKFGTINSVLVNDSAAPVILGATFRKSIEETLDTLEVEFSEAMDVVPQDAFILFSIKEITQYSFASKEKGNAVGISKKEFLISEIRGVENPSRNDSIWISPDAGVKDMNGNVQAKASNRRALLKIGQIALSFTILSGPNPFSPGVSEIANDNDIPEKIQGKRGFLVKINLGKTGPLSISEIKGTFRILDGLGNLIYTGTLLKGSVTDQNNYYFLWEGTNKKGRTVGTGSYLAHLEVETAETNSDDPPQRREVTLMIGVKRKAAEK
jgi:hypothetical protein